MHVCTYIVYCCRQIQGASNRSAVSNVMRTFPTVHPRRRIDDPIRPLRTTNGEGSHPHGRTAIPLI